ncbi:MAG: beta-ketoacyl-ACP synthase III [Candidatus Zixiibacteriota bacterium]
MTRAKIIATGSYTPEHVLTNFDLEQMVDTSDEWIRTRSGIVERRIARKDEDTSDMAVEAAKNALDMAGMKPEDIDLLIIASVTPDYRLPSQACIVQDKLGMVNAAAFDIVAACAGFIHGLSLGQAYIGTGQYKRIMVIGAEKLSYITNYKDRNTCVLFGDAAGAAILVPTDEDTGILSTFIKSDGTLAKLLYIPAGGVHNPYSMNGSGPAPEDYFLQMQGNEIYKHAVRSMGNAAERVITMSGLEKKDVDWLVPHQANIRIIQATAKRIDLSMDKVVLNIEKYGNTSAASVPLALDEAIRNGRIKHGDNIVSVAFGGGLTWGAVLFRW